MIMPLFLLNNTNIDISGIAFAENVAKTCDRITFLQKNNGVFKPPLWNFHYRSCQDGITRTFFATTHENGLKLIKRT